MGGKIPPITHNLTKIASLSKKWVVIQSLTLLRQPGPEGLWRNIRCDKALVRNSGAFSNFGLNPYFLEFQAEFWIWHSFHVFFCIYRVKYTKYHDFIREKGHWLLGLRTSYHNWPIISIFSYKYYFQDWNSNVYWNLSLRSIE